MHFLEPLQTVPKRLKRMPDHDNAKIAPSGTTAGSSSAARTLTLAGNQLDSRDLFASVREIVIAHGADRYRLRLTSQNKLILTK
jgi:hemin uptake protein HemP